MKQDDEMTLLPPARVPARERLIWEDAPLRASLIRGMKQAAAGEIYDLGSFKGYGEED